MPLVSQMPDRLCSLCPTPTGAEPALPASSGGLPPHSADADIAELAQDLRPNGVNCTRSLLWRMRIKRGQQASRPSMGTAAGVAKPCFFWFRACFNEHVNNCPQGGTFIGDVHINYYGGCSTHRAPLLSCPCAVQVTFLHFWSSDLLSLTAMSYHWLSSHQGPALSRPMCWHSWAIQSSAAAYWRTESKCWQTQHQPHPCH